MAFYFTIYQSLATVTLVCKGAGERGMRGGGRRIVGGGKNQGEQRLGEGTQVQLLSR